MSHLMPEPLATWSWRLERVRNGRTVLTRSQAATARTDLANDRAAHPESYVGYEEEYATALDELEVLSRQANRHDDLLSVLAADRRKAERESGVATVSDARSGARPRVSLAAEHDRVPAGLPEPLDQWVHRLIRYRAGVKIISPIEAARAEIHLRNEADLQPKAYRSGVAGAYFARVVRELGEIATSERPGRRDVGALTRGLSDIPA
ncbi:hypothetical protein [Leifsonia sp. C5G2]|uniref:hypothetical protein n=1 Tax=Leifsonia sp. C5G2 TaxID=2735269 RepID=UPI0015857287|nr:hypothetical protein [Leifsonia sp. C5G2]NUU06574.1 hypothetical protein [Leifsonia sp. C5G2]